jgi:hypothetical protein
MTEIPPIGLSKKGGRYNGQFRPEFSRLYEDPDLLLITPLPVRYVVGVVGKRWSGKSATLTILREELGFDVHSLTDIVRATAEAQGKDPTDRRVLQQLADEFRVEHASPDDRDSNDNAFLARCTLRHLHDRHVHHNRSLDPPRRVALNGFGHPDEIDVFCRLPQFRIVRLVGDEKAREARVPDGSPEKDAEAFGLSFANPEEAYARVDQCDLAGSEEVSPWAGDSAHSTQAVLDRVEGLALSGGVTDGGVKAEELVFDLDVESDSGQADLEAIVTQLDRQFRIP